MRIPAVQYSIYPAMYLVSFVASWYMLSNQWHGLLHSLALVSLTGLMCWLLETRYPYHKEWNVRDDFFGRDCWLYLSIIFASPAVKEFIKLCAVFAYARMDLSLFHWLPADWPLALEVAVCLVYGEFFVYWIHRISHESSGLLWRLHAVHHQIQRLYWFNGGHLHPLNSVFFTTVRVVPLMLIGARPETIIYMGTFATISGFMSHMNLGISQGPVSYVLNTPELHFWHHNLDVKKANSNYGAVLMIWDLVFRTFYLPKEKMPADEMGLKYTLPKGMVELIAYPFVPGRETPAETAK